jgi:hypothetical protein
MTQRASEVFKEVAESVAALRKQAGRRPVVYKRRGSSRFSVLLGRSDATTHAEDHEPSKEAAAA